MLIWNHTSKSNHHPVNGKASYMQHCPTTRLVLNLSSLISSMEWAFRVPDFLPMPRPISIAWLRLSWATLIRIVSGHICFVGQRRARVTGRSMPTEYRWDWYLFRVYHFWYTPSRYDLSRTMNQHMHPHIFVLAWPGKAKSVSGHACSVFSFPPVTWSISRRRHMLWMALSPTASVLRWSIGFYAKPWMPSGTTLLHSLLTCCSLIHGYHTLIIATNSHSLHTIHACLTYSFISLVCFSLRAPSWFTRIYTLTSISFNGSDIFLTSCLYYSALLLTSYAHIWYLFGI